MIFVHVFIQISNPFRSADAFGCGVSCVPASATGDCHADADGAAL
jgi:hypothetical protein